jgi:hypothetical protein
MNVSNNDKNKMQLDPKHVPNPLVSDQLSGVFQLPLGVHIVYEFNLLELLGIQAPVRFHRLLGNERLLLALADRDTYVLYLEHLSEMEVSIHRAKAIKTFNRHNIGEDVLFAYDETKRTLAVCASAKVCRMSLVRFDFAELPSKMQLHAFVFDETFKTLQAHRGSINLIPWYSQTEITILQLYFVCGNDEVVLVDSNAQVRIFSFVTLQFRYDFSPCIAYQSSTRMH